MIDRAAGLQADRYYELVGGTQLNIAEILVRKSDFIELINIDGSKLGTLKRAPYQTIFGSAVRDKPILGAFNFVDSSGVAHKLVAINAANDLSSEIYEVGSLSNTARLTSLAPSKKFTFTSLLGYVFAINETDGIRTSSNLTGWGTTHALGAPVGSIIVEYNNEPYVMGDPNAPTRVYKGTLHNPNIGALAYLSGTHSATTTLTVDSTKYLKVGMAINVYTSGTATRTAGSAGTLTISSILSDTQVTVSAGVTAADSDEIYIHDSKVAPGTMHIVWSKEKDNFELPPNGEKILGAGVSNARLLIFQENTLHRWDGAVRTTVDSDVGISTHFSFATVGRMAFWMHKGVVYRYEGDAPMPCSAAIQPVLESMTDYSICRAIGDVFNQRLFMYIGNIDCPQLKGTDMWAIYDIRKDQWDFRSDMEAAMLFKDKSGTGKEKLYLGNNHGAVYQFNYGNPTKPYSAKTNFDSQGNPETVKDYRYVIVKMPKIGGKIAIATNFNTEYLFLGDVTQTTQVFEIPAGKAIGNEISVRWYGDGEGASPEFIGYTVLYDMQGIMK